MAMAVYQLIYTQILIQSPDDHLITYLGFALAIVFFSLMLKSTKGKAWYLALVLVVLSAAFTEYLMIELD